MSLRTRIVGVLWHRVRDLRVQEFLREFVALVISRDQAIVKILHCGKGKDVEQVDEARNISPC